MKKVSLLLLSLAVGFSASAQTFSGGDGSESSPYLVKTVADLAELSTVVGGGNNMEGKFVKMDNDIAFGSSDAAVVIGTITKKFNGTFDGNNHKITGYNIASTSKTYQGLFGAINNKGVIKNVTMVSPSITVTGAYAGFICGHVNDGGVVDNCHVIDGDFNTTNGGFKGGVVGYSSGTVQNCSFTGSITTTVSAGCIVGQNYGKVLKCYSSGTIVSQVENTSTHIGGIAAVNLTFSTGATAEVSDSYFTGNITGGPGNNCGGIVASNSRGVINRCFSAGYISGNSEGSYTGGIVGNFESGTIKDCYSASTVFNESSSAVGGAVGFHYTKSEEAKLTNVVVYGSVFNGVLARHEGCELVGQDDSNEVILENCYFDNQVCGSYSKTGGKSTKELASATPLQGFDTNVWTFADGVYPRLKQFADLEVAKLYSVPVFYADGEIQSKVTKGFTLGSSFDVEWQLTESDLISVNGNKVDVKRGSKLENIVITSYLGESAKRSLAKIYPVLFAGTGTETDPYQISSFDDLKKLSDATTSQGITFENEYFKLLADIDMAGENFSPIAASTGQAFAGVFDGNGKTLKNLTIDNLTTPKLNYALFCTLSQDGVIKNLTIGETDGLKIHRNFAPIVCWNYGLIENCVNRASFTAAKGFSAGIAYINQNSGSIVNCINLGNITATADGAIGGIAYSNYGSMDADMNLGTISMAGNGTNPMGGLVATSSGTMNNLMNLGLVSGRTGSKGIGGIVGTVSANTSLNNVLSVAPVITSGSYENVGAIVGVYTAGADFKNANYDKQLALFSSELAGKGYLTTELVGEAGESMFNGNSAWTKVSGNYPVLAHFAELEEVKFFSTPVVISDGNRRDQLASGFELPANIDWSVKGNSSFKVESGKLVVELSDDFSSDELTGAKNGMSRMIPIATFGKFLQGSGSESDPYLISNAADLQKLGNMIDKSNNSFEGKYFSIMNDIDMSGIEFAPMAPVTVTAFGGNINGNLKNIKNLKISSNGSYIGLFARLGATAKIEKITIDENSSIAGAGYVGAFAGYNAGTLANCVNKATVTGTAANVGGLVGYSVGGATYSQCVNNGNVTSTKDYVGGIVGKAGDATALTKFDDCSNLADAITGNARVGGLVGQVDNAEFARCFNAGGTVTGKGANTGGLIGYSNGVVKATNLYNTSDVTGTSEVGGIAGYTYKGSASAPMSIENSFNAGTITGTKTNIGGIIGKGDANKLTDLLNMGDVTNTSASVSTSVGGAAGIVAYGVPTINRAYNVGTITAQSSVAGIVACPSSTYTPFSLNEVYSAGKVVALKAGATNVGTLLGKTSTKLTCSNVFIDGSVNPTMKAVANKDFAGTEVVDTKTLVATQFPTSDAWVYAEKHYPRLASMSTDKNFVDAANISSAALLLADGDTYDAVTNTFAVDTENLTWTGDDAFSVGEGKISMKGGSIGEHKVTVSVADLKRTIALTLNIPSGVETIDTDSNVAVATAEGVLFNADSEYAVYTMNGSLVVAGNAQAGDLVSLSSGIYVVKVADKGFVAIVK